MIRKKITAVLLMTAIISTFFPISSISIYTKSQEPESVYVRDTANLLWQGDLPDLTSKPGFKVKRSKVKKAAYDFGEFERIVIEGIENKLNYKPHTPTDDAPYVGTAEIPVEPFGIHVSDIGVILDNLLNHHPELFYIDSAFFYNFDNNTGIIRSLGICYKYEGADLLTKIEAFDNYAGDIIADIPAGTTDVEKALYVNDYFASNFNYSPEGSYNYNPLVLFEDKHGVCQAFSLAYQYIINKLNIPITYASSNEMNHIWNLIELDGEWYHADTTWADDSNVDGNARHTYFLKSDGYFENGDPDIPDDGHYNWISDVNATSTKYDHYFWNDVQSVFTPLGGDWYYTAGIRDGVTGVCQWDGESNSGKNIYTFDDYWLTGDKNSYYLGSYSGVISYGNRLLFNDANKIYSINTDGSDLREAFAPSLSNGNSIYSLFRKASQAYYFEAGFPGDDPNKMTVPLTGSNIAGINQNPGVTGIALNQLSADISLGDTVWLTASVTPKNASADLLYQSGNDAVATVDANGLVTSKGIGSTDITVTAEGYPALTAVCTVTVSEHAVSTNAPKATPGVTPDVTPSGNPTRTSAPNITPRITLKTNPVKSQLKTSVKRVKRVTKLSVKTKKKNHVLLKWKKVKGIYGYEIVYDTKKKFSAKKKTKKVKGTSVRIGKLRKGKTYYFKVRCYVKDNNKWKYGNYSKVLKVKMKK